MLRWFIVAHAIPRSSVKTTAKSWNYQVIPRITSHSWIVSNHQSKCTCGCFLKQNRAQMSTVLQKTTRIIDRPQVSTLRTRFRKSSRSSDISRERENVSFGPKRKITDPRYSSVMNLRRNHRNDGASTGLRGGGKSTCRDWATSELRRRGSIG